MNDDRPVPPDFNQCQTMRPSTWPQMPNFMTVGLVTYTQCKNKPKWIASDGKGSMSLCDECREVMIANTTIKVQFVEIKE